MRGLHALNVLLWLAQIGTAIGYAHSLPLAVLGVVGAGIALTQLRMEMQR